MQVMKRGDGGGGFRRMGGGYQRLYECVCPALCFWIWVHSKRHDVIIASTHALLTLVMSRIHHHLHTPHLEKQSILRHTKSDSTDWDSEDGRECTNGVSMCPFAHAPELTIWKVQNRATILLLGIIHI